MSSLMVHLPLIITLLTLAGAVILMVSGFLRTDVVAVLIILVLILTGVLQVSEALSGFSNTAVIITACMFVIGEAIVNTGVAQRVGELIIRYGGTSEIKILCMIMTAAALVGSFMSSLATAAIFIPITLVVAEKAGLNHKRLLMPLAVAALISGMMTLVATTPNLVLNVALKEHGHNSLSFFSFTPFGLVNLVLAMGFMALFGQNLLTGKNAPAQRKREPSIDDLLRYYQMDKSEYFLRVPEHSDLVNRSVARAQLNAQHNVILLAIQTHERGSRLRVYAAQPEMVFHPGDLLMLVGTPEHVTAFAEHFSLRIVNREISAAQRRAFFQVVGIAEVLLHPDSSLSGKTLVETQFQAAYHSQVLGIRRKGVTMTNALGGIPLKFGDVLLVCGAWKELIRLNKQKEQYLLLTLPQDYKEVIPARHKEKLALGILGVMVALIAFTILSPVVAILCATFALVTSRCVPITSVYRIIDWQTIVMIAGIMPLALAMQKTGVSSLVSEGFVALFQGAGPVLPLAGLFLTTASLGLFMVSTPVAVLMAPIAIDAGVRLGISPQACIMVVAIACSSAFVSPLGSAVAMIVREPGGYSFKDYVKTGLPLLLICMVSTVFLAWLFY